MLKYCETIQFYWGQLKKLVTRSESEWILQVFVFMHKIQFEVIYFKVGRTILLHKFLANSHQRLQQAKYIFGQNHFFFKFYFIFKPETLY